MVEKKEHKVTNIEAMPTIPFTEKIIREGKKIYWEKGIHQVKNKAVH